MIRNCAVEKRRNCTSTSMSEAVPKTFEDEGYFQFPFPPYDIQEKFMRNLYHTLDNDKIGIFESPTGTGKSLSLICGALTWLRDYEAKQEEEQRKIIAGDVVTSVDGEKEVLTEKAKEVDWVEEYFQEQKEKDVVIKAKERELDKSKQRERLSSLRKQNTKKKRKRETEGESEKLLSETTTAGDVFVTDTEDQDIVLGEYTSDNEDIRTKDSDEENSDEDETKQEDDDSDVKIFYCSRTHSQLSQFVHEVQKSPFKDWIKLVALGSRQNYCINDDVRRLKSVAKINERCLDMQKKKKEKKKDGQPTLLGKEQRKKRRKQSTSACGCPYYNYSKLDEFRDHVTVDVQDIEQLVALGKDLDTCPYYGSRHTIPKAQLVVLPYQTLLHKSTRETVGVKLKGNVVIIDEAHNLIETINGIHSSEVTLSQISMSVFQLTDYRNKYGNRLKAKNLMYIQQILFVLNVLKDVLTGNGVGKVGEAENTPKKTESSSMVTINDFLFKTRLDNVNLFKICRYCEKSLIAHKLNGFVDRYHQQIQNYTPMLSNASDENSPPSSSQFMYIVSFLDSLTNCDQDGRILLSKSTSTSKSSIKFLLLNPAVHFVDVVKECKAVVVAGGTMQPVSEFKNVLLYSAQVEPERITEFSCGHVIPPENLLAVCIDKGPAQVDLNFSYQNRNNENLIDELSRVLCNVCTVVRGGVVVFFPSYDYEDFVYQRWAKTGAVAKIEKRKKIFREAKKSGSCDNVLTRYTNAIKYPSSETNGALLLSVVGGKMSEGINFSDELGRCIVMVGLPYPNRNSPELVEKMKFLDLNIGKNAGQEHYENICMKAVNQSIGRAIRHKGDYATILLLDQRYARKSIQGKLPQWIRSQLQLHQRFGPGFSAISRFFAGKRNEVKMAS